MTIVGSGQAERPDLSGEAAGEALTALYDQHARELHRYLAGRSDAATADDLVGETFLQAWRNRGSYQPELGPARAWLYGIATNLLHKHHRSHVRLTRAVAREGARLQHGEPPETAATERVHASTQARRLTGAIEGLRPEERDVLLLVAWAGLRPSEVAAALEVNVSTVRSRLHRARTTLRACLEEDTDA